MPPSSSFSLCWQLHGKLSKPHFLFFSFFFKSKSRPFSCSTTRLDTNCTHSTRREREKPWNTTKNGDGPTVNGSRIGDEEREEENNVFFSSTRCGCGWNAHTHGNVDANSQAGYDWTRLQDEWVKLERKKKEGRERRRRVTLRMRVCVCVEAGKERCITFCLYNFLLKRQFKVHNWWADKSMDKVHL